MVESLVTRWGEGGRNFITVMKLFPAAALGFYFLLFIWTLVKRVNEYNRE